ncbi:MAG: aldo/keto reductase [Candidatus Eremiobacteraeota bacterium]|nr:aldo/keto reductase [Candidatus Eremiobacteraeota bacterium]
MVGTKPFGSTGAAVATIGQGSWNLPESGAKRTEAKRALLRGIELGMTHVDTAEMYGGGAVESALGEFLVGVPRQRLFLTTKVLPSNATYDGTVAACERSLSRLKMDYVDLFLLHWAGRHPLEETMRALETLVEQGKTRFIGVSNFDLDELREAQSYLRAHPIASNQVLYNLTERGIEHRLLPYCAEQSIALVGYTPFARGKTSRSEAALTAIATKHDATTHQVMLAFLTRTPALFAIPKAASIAHVEDNARAAELRLDAEDLAAIEIAFPVGDDGPLASL